MSRQARLGVLVLAGVVLFFAALFVIANRSFLLNDTYTLYAQFDQVAGLAPGGDVQYQGLSVGRVERVLLPEQSDQPFRVEMQVQTEAAPLIRSGTTAHIRREGFIGAPLVVLNPGTGQALEAGATLAGATPLDLFVAAEQGMATLARFDSLTAALQTLAYDLQAGEGTLGRLMQDPTAYEALLRTSREAEHALAAVVQRTDTLTQAALEASNRLMTLLDQATTGGGTLARLMQDSTLYTDAVLTSRQLQTTMQDLRHLLTQAEAGVHWGTVAAFRAAENMEALKRNWFFKGYFKNRGYWETDSLAVREKALAQTFERLAQKAETLAAWEARLEALEAQQAIDRPPPNPSPSSVPADTVLSRLQQ